MCVCVCVCVEEIVESIFQYPIEPEANFSPQIIVCVSSTKDVE
jgi:hypothetical protein